MAFLPVSNPKGRKRACIDTLKGMRTQYKYCSGEWLEVGAGDLSVRLWGQSFADQCIRVEMIHQSDDM